MVSWKKTRLHLRLRLKSGCALAGVKRTNWDNTLSLLFRLLGELSSKDEKRILLCTPRHDLSCLLQSPARNARATSYFFYSFVVDCLQKPARAYQRGVAFHGKLQKTSAGEKRSIPMREEQKLGYQPKVSGLKAYRIPGGPASAQTVHLIRRHVYGWCSVLASAKKAFEKDVSLF